MMPSDAYKRIKTVNIYHNRCYIIDFQFFDKDQKVIFRLGETGSDYCVETIVLRDNEVIIGIIAKLYKDTQSTYSDFQFRIISL